ncbi:MAG: hypothetical protein Q9227_004994 [Pyrenula ochraceoflavens]
MDIPYDHIQESSLPGDRSSTPTPTQQQSAQSEATLNDEFQQTIRAFSNSPWGAKLGGIWGNVRKQGETYYQDARKEAEAASGEALKGLSGLTTNIVERTKGLSLGEKGVAENNASSDEKGKEKEGDADKISGEDVQENESFLARVRAQAMKGLKDIQKAEDAADEALLRFGTNMRDFLRDAVSVAPPTDDTQKGAVLFESKDPSTGKRVIHASRFEASLHVIHSNLDGFLKDPDSPQWQNFKSNFRIDEKTEDISTDLEKFPGLRRAMEQCVPEKVDYGDFWCRYYFYRSAVESEEQKRKELLKGASNSNDSDDLGWDSDDDEGAPSTPQAAKSKPHHKPSDSTITIQPKSSPDSGHLKPSGRNSNEHSVADSDASYDIVSRQASTTPGSPIDEKGKAKEGGEQKTEDDSDEDWE